MAQTKSMLVRYLPLNAPIRTAFVSRGILRQTFPDGSVEVVDLDVRGLSGRPVIRWTTADRVIEILERTSAD